MLDLLGAGAGDVDVCGHGLDLCTMSDGDGDFLLEPLPEDADVIVTMEKDAHLPTAFLHDTSVDEEWEKTLMPLSLVEAMGARVDTTLDDDRGHVLFILWSARDYSAVRVPDVTFTLDAEAVTFYQAPDGMPDPELGATSTYGAGGAFNVAPGEYTLTLSGGDVTCAPWFSHTFDPGEPVPVTVLAGWASYLDLVCT